MCTPLVYRGLVYIVKYNGVLSAYDEKTGEVKFQQRLAGGLSAFTSSPIAADGKVYLASEEGHVYVLKAGPAFEVLAIKTSPDDAATRLAVQGPLRSHCARMRQAAHTPHTGFFQHSPPFCRNR